MPTWIARLVRLLALYGRRVPWTRVLLAAQWLYERGRDNLTPAERQELGRILRKSKGDPRKLTVKERERVRALLISGVTGRKPK